MEETKEMNTITMEEKKDNPISAAFDKIFHFKERGGTLGSEIGAGIGAFLIAAASFLMNTQIIGSVYGNYAGSYLAITLVAMLGTLLLGILTNRPLVMSANLALSTSMVSVISAHAGMTYANLLVLTTIASLFALILSILPLGKKLSALIPASIRKAMPIAVGLMVFLEAVQASGLVTSSGLATLQSGGNEGLHSMYIVLMLISVLAFIGMKVFHVRKSAFRLYGTLIGLMWAFGIMFYTSYFIGGQTATTAVYERVNLFVTTDGASCYNIGLGFSSVQWGTLFTKGFDFSGVENAGLVWVKGLIIYTIFALTSNVAYVNAAAASGDYLAEDGTVAETKKASVVVHATNTLGGAVLGSPMATVSPSSALLSNDEAKTGLSSIVCALGFFVLLFTWITFGLTATTTNGVGMWIEQSETKLAAYVQDVFAFADIIMALVALTMLKALKNINIKSVREVIGLIAVIAGTLTTNDIAFGVAIGVIADFFASFVEKKEDDKIVTGVIAAGIMAIYVIFAIM